MSIVILVDKKSIASRNIKDKLVNHHNVFVKTDKRFDDETVYQYEDAYLISTNERSVYCEFIDRRIHEELGIDIDLLLFATTHTSKSGIPSLSAHAIGNWGTAELGGIDNTLCRAAEAFMKEAIIYMEQQHEKFKNIANFDVIQEVTHHGPATNVPTMFIEIGSSDKEWDIPEAGIFIAETIIYLVDNQKSIRDKPYVAAFGIGGTHTCSNFHKIIINDKEIALAHVCPKYMLDDLSKENIKAAIEKTMNSCKHVILDWKGLGQNKERILNVLDELSIKYQKTKDFKYD